MTALDPLAVPCDRCNGKGRVRLAHPLRPVSRWIEIECEYCAHARAAEKKEENRAER